MQNPVQEGLNQPVQPSQNVSDPSVPLASSEEKKKSKLPLILLILFIFLLFGGIAVGVYVMNKNNETDEEPTTVSSTTTTTETETTTTTTTEDGQDDEDPYKGWTEILLFDDEYSMMIPPNWELTEQEIDETPGSEETFPIAHFNNTSTSIDMFFGQSTGEGEAGTIGGCDIGKGDSQKLFDLTFLDREEEIIVKECYSDNKLFDRTINAYFEDIQVGTFPNLTFGITINDTTSTLEELKEEYADIKTVLESVKVIK